MGQLLFVAIVVLVSALAAVRFVDTGTPAPKPTAGTQAAAPVAGGRVVAIADDGRGHFQVRARVDGRPIDFMVDTGASAIALRESAAARLGIRPSERDYTIRVSTANGIAKGAPVILDVVDIDGVVVRDVRAIVQPDEALAFNLLGMTYLSRVRFSHERGRLVIEQ
jgi:aspartyl protease family protein